MTTLRRRGARSQREQYRYGQKSPGVHGSGSAGEAVGRGVVEFGCSWEAGGGVAAARD